MKTWKWLLVVAVEGSLVWSAYFLARYSNGRRPMKMDTKAASDTQETERVWKLHREWTEEEEKEWGREQQELRRQWEEFINSPKYLELARKWEEVRNSPEYQAKKSVIDKKWHEIGVRSQKWYEKHWYHMPYEDEEYRIICEEEEKIQKEYEDLEREFSKKLGGIPPRTIE